MGKLQDRFERDLRIRGLAENTCTTYINCVRVFVRFFGKSPELATIEDINRYQYYLIRERKVAWSTHNLAVYALRFFFCITLKRNWDVKHIPYQKTGRKLPEILSQQEVAVLLTVLANIKHRAILMTLYAGGLRLSEVVALKITDIDSSRMVIRIEQAKGNKDRYVMLSEKLLGVLRDYWREYRPAHFLFPGRDPLLPLHPRSVQSALKLAVKQAGINKRVTVHTLRHSFATHLLENNVNIRVIQHLLGHRSLHSTEVYTHVAKNYLHETQSPLEHLNV